MSEKKSSLLIFLGSLVKHRRLIFTNVFLITLAAALLSLILPKWYRATVVLLPPEKTESLSDLAISMGLKGLAMGGGGFALPVMASPSDLLASITESRAVAEWVVDSLKLQGPLKAKSSEHAVYLLRKNLDTRVKADGIIEISFMAPDRELVASVANTVAIALDHINRQHKSQKARDMRRFIEEELEENNRNLQRAEQALSEFQSTHKAISLDAQTTASIGAAAELYGQLTIEQINLKVLEKSHAPNHPDVINLKYKIAEIERRMRQLQEGGTKAADSSGNLMSIPFSELPELAVRYLQLMRELKKQESLHEILVSQLEQAKITEAMDTPTISVLDWAIPPTQKYKPQRIMMVLTAFILSLVWSIALIVLFDKWNDFKNANPEKYRLVAGMLTDLRRDLFGFKRKPGA